MAGSKEGARKAALTNKKKYGSDFYARIGAKSWDNPERSRETGFSLMQPEERARLGAEGGKKNKGKKYDKQGWRKVGDKIEIEGETYKVALVEYLPPEEAIEEIRDITKDSSGTS